MSRETSDLAEAVQQSWLRFLDVYEPLRPDLYRYCRHLTRSPWDAEDMAQDTLARAYVTLGCLAEPPPNPRAWLFRVASNLWLNRTRRARNVLAERDGTEEAASAPEPRAEREAAGTLLAQLSPQERAAVVRVELQGERIARLSNFRHAPELSLEVCHELGVPFRTHGYRPQLRSMQ